MNAGKRNKAAASIAKLSGLTAGEPDVRIYAKGGRMALVEIKRFKGVRSQAQIDRHALLKSLGFEVFTVWLVDETEARRSAAIYALHLLPLGSATP
jgi:hypothetical protein